MAGKRGSKAKQNTVSINSLKFLYLSSLISRSYTSFERLGFGKSVESSATEGENKK